MTRGTKLGLVSAVGLLAIVAIAGIVIARSDWLRESLRDKIVSEIESDTGGKAEIAALRFDWKTLTAELDNLTIHGNEPAGEPPLLRTGKVLIQLKVSSLLNLTREITIASLIVDRPDAHLIVYPNGRTNVPEPKIVRKADRSAAETVLDLKIGHFDLQRGTVAMKRPGQMPKVTPWDAAGEDLRSLLVFDGSGPRYRGEIGIHPLNVRWRKSDSVPVDVKASVSLEKNRVQITSATLSTKDSHLDLTGALDNFAAPRTAVNYKGSISVEELGRFFALKSKQSGIVAVNGVARFAGATDYSLNGNLHAVDLTYRDADIHLDHVRAEGNIAGDPRRIALGGIRIAALGGEIGGKAVLLNFSHFEVQGDVERFDMRQLAGLVSPQKIPYDGLVSGPFRASGEISRPAQSLQASGHFNVSPAGASPVTGSLQAKYDGASGAIAIDNSTLVLPNTRVDLSGTLATGLHVHLQSTNLSDLPPEFAVPVKLQNGSAAFDGTVTGTVSSPRIAGRIALANVVYSGQKVDALTGDIAMEKSSARIADGRLSLGTARAGVQGSIGLRDWKPAENAPLTADVTVHNADLATLLQLAGQKGFPARGSFSTTAHIEGTLRNPHASADVNLVNGSIYGEPFDRIVGKLGYLNGGTETGDFQIHAGSGLVNLKTTLDQAKITFTVSSNRVPLGQVQSLRPYQSLISGSAQVNATGAVTLSKSRGGRTQFQIATLQGDADLMKGRIHGEPFDHLSFKLDSPNAGLQTATAQLNSGVQRLNAKATFEHAATDLLNGKIAFDVSSDRLSLAQLETLQSYRPGVSGNVQMSVHGSVAISQSKAGPQFKLASLEADVNASSLSMDGKPLGDAHLIAKTQGTALSAHLESGIANSSIRGDGAWQLTGDYPGKAEITFSKLDLSAIRKFVVLPAGSQDLGGTVEGKANFSGPAMKPQSWTGALEIPRIEVKPAPGFTLTNSGPIRVSMSKSVVRIENMHFVAQATDVSFTGAVDLNNRKSPLDVRVDGNVDLALLHTFERDVSSSGTVATNATIRGNFGAPLIAGRMELKNANFDMAGVPNGLTNANGIVIFDATRATIQNLTAESGGGKVRAAGFVAYGNGPPLFRLRANATEVRVRYPEGVSTVANAAISLTGNTDRSLLAGNVTILRTGFNPRTDLGSVISGSAAPVQTPATRTGLLGGMHFDVQLDTSPDITFVAAQAEGIQAEASLHLRGTPSNPVLAGRVNITQGELTFFGNKYVINQGSISFFNPVKLEPILNIDLETRARGVDVILTVSGTPSKLNVTYRSDPPLQFSDIVALLATGRAPADPSIAARQTGPPQTWQQMGASAIVGQAIANPVGGRLQRFFGVSKLKIDPLVAGVTGRTQTRLTIEQQVTPDITFTYITDVTSTNPQIVRVEWAMNRQWSAVAIRDETSSFGIDFLFKKRFK